MTDFINHEKKWCLLTQYLFTISINGLLSLLELSSKKAVVSKCLEVKHYYYEDMTMLGALTASSYKIFSRLCALKVLQELQTKIFGGMYMCLKIINQKYLAPA